MPNITEIVNHLATQHRSTECWTFEEDLVASKRMRLVQTKTRNIFGFDVITINRQGQEIQRKRRYAKYVTEKLGNGIDLDMVYIPGGEFMMGSPLDEGGNSEKPQHKVTVPSFFLGKYPVTQAQYQQVMSNNPSSFRGHDRPVEKVSWDEAVEFCNQLSKQTGTEYRLPTEAEWEYACRAGTLTQYHFGDAITDKLANYSGNIGETTVVGKYPPNAFGLYDMHGNVWEWCQDDWHDTYQDAPEDGSAWLGDLHSSNTTPARQFSLRTMIQNLIARLLKRESLSEKRINKVIRGGSWFGVPEFCRSAARLDGSRDDRGDAVGLRVVCVVLETT